MDDISVEVKNLIEDLELVPLSVLTPTILKLIEQEVLFREFDDSPNEKLYREYFYQRMQQRRLKRKKQCLVEQDKQFRLNF